MATKRTAEQLAVLATHTRIFTELDTDYLISLYADNRKKSEKIELEYIALRDVLTARLEAAGGLVFAEVDGKKVRVSPRGGTYVTYDVDVLIDAVGRGEVTMDVIEEVTERVVIKDAWEQAIAAGRISPKLVALAKRDKDRAKSVSILPSDSPHARDRE